MKILDMNDFEVYIHKLALGECADEEVCTVPEATIACFEEEWDGNTISNLIRQLFEGLDVWRRVGNLETWNGTTYVRSVIAFIGHPAEHGILVSSLDGGDDVEEDW